MQRVALILGAAATGLLVLPGAASASNWRLQAFEGLEVSKVAVNGRNPAAITAVAGGKLFVTLDAGASWLPGLLPALAYAVAYDPVYAGRIYAGTANGLYLSNNGGLSWQAFGDSLTSRKTVTALVVSEEYIYAGMYNGAGTPVRLLRFNREGAVQDMNLPSDNIAALEYDSSRHRLYVGAAGGVYASDNQGVSWFGGGRGAGRFSVGVIAKPGFIWQLSADGLFRSNDDGNSWNKLAGPDNINGTYYGQDMHTSGLAVSGNQAFYGSWSIGFPYRFLVNYDGSGAHSILNAKVFSLAASGTRVWAATLNGLWMNDVQAASQPRVQRPVVIIPGILGSMPTPASLATYATRSFLGFWDQPYQTPFVLDPFGHGFDGLITALEGRGYEFGKSLFAFPYNWMQDNTVTASQLARKLVEIRQICQCAQVDIISHSMGGLVARHYIQSPAYRQDVRNLVQLGTPNAGSVASYAPWESGSYPSLSPNFNDRLFNVVVSSLINGKLLAEARVKIIRQAIPSLRQLLPIFNYIRNRQYPLGYPTNPFLEQLNAHGEINGLKQRVAVYTVGSKDHATLESLAVSPERPGANLWPHGEVEATYNGSGDQVVPFASLEALAKASNALGEDHHGIISAAVPFILQTLLGEYVPDTVRPSLPPTRALAVYASGAVALSITDPSGRVVNGGRTEIPDSYYSGLDVRPQLAVISNYAHGGYRITVSAQAGGQYTIGTAEINGVEADGAGGVDETRFNAEISSETTHSYRYDTAANSLIDLNLPALTGPRLEGLVVFGGQLHRPVEVAIAEIGTWYPGQSEETRYKLPTRHTNPTVPESLASRNPWFEVILLGILAALLLYLLVKH